ncbi:FAD-dependent oxidoreductase, partial [Streptomyces sp. NPDC005921]
STIGVRSAPMCLRYQIHASGLIDYLPGPLIGVDDKERDRHLAGARELSMSMLYWLQTEAPRPDGGTGWPGLRLRGDVLGTADGLAKAPYIRESRRIVARRRIVEQDLSLAVRGEHGAMPYPDSVGIGMYRIDLHPSTGGDTYIDVASSPFRIPLGALLPVRVRNLLPVCKNIGTTHITNGCYRLHPVEWNIGEAAGSLAAHCLDHRLEPGQASGTTRPSSASSAPTRPPTPIRIPTPAPTTGRCSAAAPTPAPAPAKNGARAGSSRSATSDGGSRATYGSPSATATRTTT